MKKKLIIYSDGGARGNPGPAGIGVVIIDDDSGETVETHSEFVGEKTNNQAEYLALILGLQRAGDLGAAEVTCVLDSELAVKQMKGEYRVKNGNIKPLFADAKELVKRIEKVNFLAVRRAENKVADKLVNQALDEEAKK